VWGYRSLGVCGKGASMSGLGKPPAGYGDLGVTARWLGSAASSEWGKPFGYELQQPRAVSNGDNLTNETDPRHLQNCISELGYLLHLLGFLASLRQQIGEKGDAGFAQTTV
jgi:hypothetical protein